MESTRPGGWRFLGMMATHVLPTFEPTPQLTPTWIGLAFSGRAAALFAVLAGVGLALSTGKQRPPEGAALAAARRGIALRALVIAAVGLSLGGLEVNIAIILVHYALLFLCVLPFLGLRLKAPVRAGGRLDRWLPRCWPTCCGPGCWPPIRPCSWATTRAGRTCPRPARLLGDLFLTGYYPVFQWIAYLLVGLVIGRLALTKAAVPVLLLAGGTAVAVLRQVAGDVLMEDWGGRAALQADAGDPGYPLESLLQVNLAGIDQSGSWWWLASSCTAFRHHAGPAAHLRGRRRRGRRVPAAGPAGRLAGAGPAAAAARRRRHDAEPLHGARVRGGRPAPTSRCPPGWTVEGVYWAQAVGDAGDRQSLRGPGVARAAGVGGPCRQPGWAATSRPGPLGGSARTAGVGTPVGSG